MASASSRARWLGRWSRRRREASVPSRQLGTSSRTRRRARAHVSTHGLASRDRPDRSRAMRRNPRSNRTLWPTITASPMNSSSVGQHRLDPRGGHDHGLADAGQDGDLGRHGHARVDQRLERARADAAGRLDRADLGDAARFGRAAGRLEVDHAEGDLVERGAEIVEAALERHPPVVPNRRSLVKDRRDRGLEGGARQGGAAGWMTPGWRSGRREACRPEPQRWARIRSAGARDPLPLHELREPDPLRRDHHPPHPGVPPLQRRRRAVGRGRRGARRGGRGRVLPLVRLRHRRWSRSRRTRTRTRRSRSGDDPVLPVTPPS